MFHLFSVSSCTLSFPSFLNSRGLSSPAACSWNRPTCEVLSSSSDNQEALLPAAAASLGLPPPSHETVHHPFIRLSIQHSVGGCSWVTDFRFVCLQVLTLGSAGLGWALKSKGGWQDVLSQGPVLKASGEGPAWCGGSAAIPPGMAGFSGAPCLGLRVHVPKWWEKLGKVTRKPGLASLNALRPGSQKSPPSAFFACGSWRSVFWKSLMLLQCLGQWR